MKALGSMAAELSWFLLRLIHSRFEMPLKLSAGMLLILLSAIQKGKIDQTDQTGEVLKDLNLSWLIRATSYCGPQVPYLGFKNGTLG